MSDSILLHVEGGLARVTFNRPASLNAMDFEMGGRWRDVLTEAEVDAGDAGVPARELFAALPVAVLRNLA